VRSIWLFRALLVVEILLLLAAIPSSMPHNREIDAALNRWTENRTEVNSRTFQAAMDRALAPERRRVKIALSLAVANAFVLLLLMRTMRKR
jgi:ferric-dicitrate binding protein FerR (iron transport regulator)